VQLRCRSAWVLTSAARSSTRPQQRTHEVAPRFRAGTREICCEVPVRRVKTHARSALALLKGFFPASLFALISTFIDDTANFNFDRVTCAVSLQLFILFMSGQGFRFKPSKLMYPATRNELTGVVGDTIRRSISLTEDKALKNAEKCAEARTRSAHTLGLCEAVSLESIRTSHNN
jgi:hypothetical protein